jgi:hypothetical protein
MIKELQILLEVEKALKLMGFVNFSRSDELKSHLENIRNLQLQSFVENETYNFVLSDALQEKEKENESNKNNKSQISQLSGTGTLYISRH